MHRSPVDYLLAQHWEPTGLDVEGCARHTRAVEEATAQDEGPRMAKVIIKISIHSLLQLINRILLGSIHPVQDNTLHRRADLLVAVQKINPAVLDALGLEQRGRDLRHSLAAHLAPAGLGLAQLDLAGGVRGQCPRPQVDPDEVLAPLGRLLVEGLVRGELGDVVVGEDLVVDFLGGLVSRIVGLACWLLWLACGGRGEGGSPSSRRRSTSWACSGASRGTRCSGSG